MTLEATFSDETMTLDGELGEVLTIQTVKPINATADMTQPVGVDSDGKLFTAAIVGLDGKDGQDGKNGKDGVSPMVSVYEIEGGHYVSIIDANGNKTFHVMDGMDGTNGIDTTHSWDGTVLTVTSASGTSSMDLKGETGFSPIVKAKSTTEGIRLEITDENGMTSNSLIRHGEDGKDGIDGYSPVARMDLFDEGIRLTIEGRSEAVSTMIYHGTNGTDGKDGKSAYEYAKDGGYNGTEAEFAAKLAEGHPVTSVNGKTGVVTLDRTDLKLISESWTFELEDGTSVVKSVILSSDTATE